MFFLILTQVVYIQEVHRINLTGITWIASETWAKTKLIKPEDMNNAEGLLGLIPDAPFPEKFQVLCLKRHRPIKMF